MTEDELNTFFIKFVKEEDYLMNMHFEADYSTHAIPPDSTLWYSGIDLFATFLVLHAVNKLNILEDVHAMKWIAMDADMSWWAYHDKPKIEGGGSTWSVKDGKPESVMFLCKTPDCPLHWDESRMEIVR